ncbi:MAG: helix-turn-helix domain-containing protein [Armatimonadetes bacterium]|nr:helix-turn-helix domain-containing protein [Armatimonadota bacterium]
MIQMELWGTVKTAKYLDMHPETLRKKTKAQEIPAYRVGGRWKYSRETLDEWIAEGCPCLGQQDERSER